jgi:MGT family glycosyltransferase
MSYNFLLASWGTSGNLNPLLTAGRQLRRNGHHVRILADQAMREQVEDSEFEFCSWYRAPTGTAADPTDVSDLKDWIRRAIYDPCAAYAADIRDEIGRTPTDAVLAIDVLFGAVPGAEAADVPAALLSPHISIRPLPGVPPAGSGLMPPKTQEDLAEIAAANDALAEQLNAHLPILNKALARFGIAGLADAVEFYDRPDRLFLAVSRAFDFPAAALPPNFRYVGPLLDQPSWAKPWSAPWPARSGRPRVLIACSTGEQGQGELIQRVIDAMGRLDIDAVTTAGPTLDIADFRAPPNVHLLPSAPHDAVMKEVSVVVSQGGHGTVNRALINGRPLLVLPLGRDQDDNAARVVARGAGLRLPAAATAAEIADAVHRLIQEPHFATAARRVGDAIQADMDGCILVREMEAMVAARRRIGRDARPPLLRRSGGNLL